MSSVTSPFLLPFDTSLLQRHVSTPVGGRLHFFLPNWRCISSDHWVLSAVQGYELDFANPPALPIQTLAPHPLRFSVSEEALVTSEVDALFEKRAIEKVPIDDRANSFISQIFLRAKKDGGWRPVFNLRHLNTYLRYDHFKMEGLFMLQGLLKAGNYVAKLDLKDAYFTVPMAQRHRRFLRFEWRGQLWQFAVLCFGLSLAPRVFTKLLKPIVTILRRQGIHLIIFLDDILLINETAEGLQADLTFCISLLETLGFILNLAKSVLPPAQRLDFLGLTLDTNLLKLFIPPDKVTDIVALGQLLRSANTICLRNLAKFIGKVNATRMALLPSPLFSRHLQQDLIRGLHHFSSYNAYVVLSSEAHQELDFWLAEVWGWNGRNIFPSEPRLTITSDASKTGWGAVSSDGRSVSGVWSCSEAVNSINYLELFASFLALKALAAQESNCHLLLQSDNRTTVAYLNRLGGTRSLPLLQLALRLWQWCLNRSVTIEAVHIPGLQNTAADGESRRCHHSSDWKLHPDMFATLWHQFGPFDVDLFASRNNAQMHPFFSWMLDPDAQATDAFAQSWRGLHGYTFPPFALLHRVLKKVHLDLCRVLLIAPVWPSQPWYPVLLMSLTDFPTLLPQWPHLLQAPSGDYHPLIQTSSLLLAAWPLSGCTSDRLAFQQQLPRLSLGSSHQALQSSTSQPSANGIVGVCNDLLIRFRPL